MRLADVIAILDRLYDPRWAEPWDRVGLVCGDPEAEVRRIHFAVDPVRAVVDEALAAGADLLVVHHPLLLSPVHDVAASSPKGRVVHDLIRGGTALFTAHTNADVPAHGVNAAIAECLGLLDPEVLAPTDAAGLDKLVVFVPVGHAEQVRRALAEAGAGAIGAYDGCSFSVVGEGRFRPLDGAIPAVGEVGRPEVVEESRVEAVVPRARRTAVVEALRAAHPYEEPAFDLVELVDPPGGFATGEGPASTRGHGRVGRLAAPTTLADFAAHVASSFPATAHGVRVAGDPDRVVSRVAVCAGSGDSLLEDARRAGADVFVTSDLKHHRASEFLEAGGPAIVDVAHWSSEWTWLPVAEREVRSALAAMGAQASAGDTVETYVSTLVTDPWTFRA